LPQDDVIGNSFFNFLNDRDVEEIRSNFNQLLNGDKASYRGHILLKVQFGEYRSTRISLSVLNEGKENNIKIIGTLTDIEDKKQAEHALKEVEKRYRAIVENAQGGIYQIALDGTLISANPAFAHILGFATVEDLKAGPKNPRSTVLSVEEEAMIVAFRQYTLLPLDDCLYALQPTIPHLTRSSLHRCFQRHDISRLPEVEEQTGKPKRQKFKTYPIGYFHIDIAQLQTSQSKLYMFVAIDRTSKFALVELVTSAGKMQASAFLNKLVETVPYKIHTILTDNGIQFDLQEKRHVRL